jgi:uncharacterized membrane protein SpoIIM required for sporulation
MWNRDEYLKDSVFKQATAFVFSRLKLLSVLNAIFFGVASLTGIIASFVIPVSVYYGQPVYVLPQSLYSNVALIFLFIFCFNLCVSSLAFVTLPGFLFFPLSSVFLGLRAVFWGLIFDSVPLGIFLVALPTAVLEGEAYVMAAAVGTTVGYSWLMQPRDLQRRKAFADALKKDVKAYAFVIFLLLAAAAVESMTITLFQL